MLEIYLTRHGATEWNVENRLQGSLNSDLTESGVRNATALGRRLSDIEFTRIYVSPSKRALETAKLIISDDSSFTIIEELNEISFGDWEGKTREEIELKGKEEYDNFWSRPHKYNHLHHNGESLEAFKQRVAVAMKRILSESPEGRILIVTHGVVIRALMAFFWNIPLVKMWDPPNIHGTSLSIVRFDGDHFEKVILGDTIHMKE
ncbi:histidine phosphatase family protein [Rossellomorea vietnamensis]|uniref:histidine phosphatase family protein n=1 Tax=Rossellomorea vietnamensis TaxID=218284 RepID=UPI0005571264|nr:histidine phosphatase family protein [Rossellomorea vietnamensis]